MTTMSQEQDILDSPLLLPYLTPPPSSLSLSSRRRRTTEEFQEFLACARKSPVFVNLTNIPLNDTDRLWDYFTYGGGKQQHPELQQRQRERPVTTSERPSSTLRTAVMSAAVGYPYEYFEMFVGSLREVYDGDVWLQVSATINDTRIVTYLQRHGVQTMVEKPITGSDKYAKARDRFTFFEKVCRGDQYDLCLQTDFRDSVFQRDPFVEFYGHQPQLGHGSDSYQPEMIHIYRHNAVIDEKNWHLSKLSECGIGHRVYARYLIGRKICNAGSTIATPGVWRQLAHYNRIWRKCNDQVIYNIWIYAAGSIELNRTSNPYNGTAISYVFNEPGMGAINIVYKKAFIRFDSHGRFLNKDCRVSPVVHQYDRVKQYKKKYTIK
jgi:hypothetical protein